MERSHKVLWRDLDRTTAREDHAATWSGGFEVSFCIILEKRPKIKWDYKIDQIMSNYTYILNPNVLENNEVALLVLMVNVADGKNTDGKNARIMLVGQFIYLL